jgi:hypothetical protein
MRRIAIACAAAAALLSTAPAALAGQKLLLEHENGQPVLAGEATGLLLSLIAVNQGAPCERLESGTLLGNDKSTDKLAFGTVTRETCTSEAALGGVTKEAKLTAKGAYSLKFASKLVYRLPGPCVYDLSKMGGTFRTGGFLEQGVAGTGKLYKKGSSPSCPREEAFEGTSVFLGEGDEYLIAELRG